MPLDTSLALQVKPIQVADPLNALARVTQIQGLQDQQQLHQLQIGEAQRKADEGKRFNALYAGAVRPDGTLDRNALLTGAASQGMGSRIPELTKTFAEQDKAQSDAQKQMLELVKTRAEVAGQRFGYVRQNPTLENAHAALDSLAQEKVFTPEAVARYKEQLTPENVGAFADQMLRTALGAKDQLSKYETRDTGGAVQTVGVDPVSGKATVVNSIDKTISPDAQLSANTSTANNLRSVQASRDNAAATREVAKATRDAATIQTDFKNEQKLRQEFEALPEVKNYKQAFPSYAGIVDAAKRSTPMSDINIVYGLAKLYDPNSVVREGEYATVANSPAIPERVKGWAQYLAGGGKLTPEVKRQILAEAESRIASYGNEYEKAVSSYVPVATGRGMNPASVFPGTGDFEPGGKRKAKTVDLGALPSGGGKVVDFGSLK